jgi:integrase
VKQVASLKEEGRHADGGGLYLRISKGGGRSWVFMRAEDGRRVEIGLGSAQSISLAIARRIASEMREAVATGKNPRHVLAPVIAVEAARVPSFGEFAEEYISSVEAGWKSPVHRQQWRSSLRDHAQSLHDLPVDVVGTEDILAVLTPIWLLKAETAKRVRGRIEKILDAAKARKLRPADAMNPATLRGHLSVLLPTQKRLQRGHHPALPWQEAPAFMAKLRQRGAMAARCLEFAILTAARSGEALGATWREIDLIAKLWTLPASRMKAGVEHVVPLSRAALDLLGSVQPTIFEAHSTVFGVGGAPRSNMAMAMLLRRMKHGDITTHGFRSTFRDWAGDATDHPRDLIETALAHTITNKAERAYRRGTAIERRRELMEDWALFLNTPPKTTT